MVSDTDIKQNILNIGRRRERVIYYRPDGTPTLELPADPQSRMYYMMKGFTLKPKEGEDGVKCPLCEFRSQSALGLRSHLRVHITETNEEKKE